MSSLSANTGEYAPADKAKPRRFMFGVAILAVLGLVVCVDVFFGAKPESTKLQEAYDQALSTDEERNLQILEQLAIMDTEVERGYKAATMARERMALEFDGASKFFEDQLEELAAGGGRGIKGAAAGTAKALATVQEQAARAVEDLTPAAVGQAVRFVKSNAKWLAANNIPLVQNIENLEMINHKFLHTTMDFGATVQRIWEDNRITTKYIRYMQRPRYQKDRVIRKLFTTVFKRQLGSLENALVKMTDIEGNMKSLTNKMQRQISKMSTASSVVQGTIDKKLMKFKLRLAENEVNVQENMKEIKRTNDPNNQVKFYEEVVPKIIKNNSQLACNANKIMKHAQYGQNCVTEEGWFTDSTDCKWVQKVPAIKQDCESKIATYTNSRNRNNLALERNYERRKAAVRNAYNRKLENQMMNKIKKLEGLFKLQHTFYLQKKEMEVRVEYNIEQKAKWAYHMATLTMHGAQVLKSADKLLYIVKLYKEKVDASATELKNIATGDLAPDWFKGTHKPSDMSGINKTQDGESFDDSVKRKTDAFEEDEDDIFFEMFLDAIVQENKKIDKDAKATLKKIKAKVDGWGNPVGDLAELEELYALY